jgi:hypothetical protein
VTSRTSGHLVASDGDELLEQPAVGSRIEPVEPREENTPRAPIGCIGQEASAISSADRPVIERLKKRSSAWSA